ncbi:hypothetical protein ABT324_27465 [Saccharopolyspora sp. NPDC000359]|uniref:hypothetical protein n=1 Tax=Saccharopolyspora sp. NPDC000359 TaxID=3154251 RepID=UPI0033170C6A
MDADRLRCPRRHRDDALAVVLRQREHEVPAELLDLPPHPDDLFVKVEVLQPETEQLALAQAARRAEDRQRSDFSTSIGGVRYLAMSDNAIPPYVSPNSSRC